MRIEQRSGVQILGRPNLNNIEMVRQSIKHLEFKSWAGQILGRSWERDLEFKSWAGQILSTLKWFDNASTSTQVAVLPWRNDGEVGTANALHASA